MRITYRYKNVKDYWKERWENIPADFPMKNRDAYPLKYAELTIKSKGKILEAGCGAGRILRYYKDKGFDITGIDFIGGAVEKLKKIDPELNVEVGNIANLRFKDGYFKYILAFGIYHNLEYDIERAIRETYRVLEPGGKVCVSFRADNLHTRLNDWLAARQAKKIGLGKKKRVFHKMNLTRSEFVELFKGNGFVVESIFPVENMPIFYKITLFRAREHKRFDENLARKEGYKLSRFGNLLQKVIFKYFPDSFCNIFVLIAQKPGLGKEKNTT